MSFLSNLGKYNNKLIFCTKIFVKNENQVTDIYVGEMRYTSFTCCFCLDQSTVTEKRVILNDYITITNS
jgi:hypothetical protein